MEEICKQAVMVAPDSQRSQSLILSVSFGNGITHLVDSKNDNQLTLDDVEGARV